MQSMKNFVEELKWRGMIQDIMPGTEEKLMEGPQAAYVGIDPTADSLHIGHLVSVVPAAEFLECTVSERFLIVENKLFSVLCL